MRLNLWGDSDSINNVKELTIEWQKYLRSIKFFESKIRAKGGQKFSYGAYQCGSKPKKSEKISFSKGPH